MDSDVTFWGRRLLLLWLKKEVTKPQAPTSWWEASGSVVERFQRCWSEDSDRHLPQFWTPGLSLKVVYLYLTYLFHKSWEAFCIPNFQLWHKYIPRHFVRPTLRRWRFEFVFCKSCRAPKKGTNSSYESYIFPNLGCFCRLPQYDQGERSSSGTGWPSPGQDLGQQHEKVRKSGIKIINKNHKKITSVRPSDQNVLRRHFNKRFVDVRWWRMSNYWCSSRQRGRSQSLYTNCVRFERVTSWVHVRMESQIKDQYCSDYTSQFDFALCLKITIKL